ncbi:MAG TPA: hypothetical protein VGP31_12205 [Planosporangium sp.]|nr:hypothetical protein [Planosporangium sp.]
MTKTATPHEGSERSRVRRLLPVTAIVIAVAGPIAAGTGAFAAGTMDTVTYHPTDDAYTSSARANLNTGGYDRLVSGTSGGDRMVTYLKFKVGTLTAGSTVTVTGASVTLTRDEHHLPGTVSLSALAGPDGRRTS